MLILEDLFERFAPLIRASGARFNRHKLRFTSKKRTIAPAYAHLSENLHQRSLRAMMRSGSERIRSMRGLMAERLRTGLQIREARFDSGSGLHTSFISSHPALEASATRARAFARSHAAPEHKLSGAHIGQEPCQFHLQLVRSVADRFRFLENHTGHLPRLVRYIADRIDIIADALRAFR